MNKNSICVNLKHFSAGIFMFFITFCACHKSEKENIQPDGDEMSVTFAVKLPSIPAAGLKTYAVTEDDENELREVDVLVFKVEGGDEKFSYRTKGLAAPPVEGVAQLTAKLRRDENAGNQYRLVILANARQQLSDYSINLGETKRHLQNNLIYTHTGEWEARLDESSFTPLPMWGETDVIDGMTVPMNITGEISLMRSLARVDVAITGAASDRFELTEVIVFNSNQNGLVIPNPDHLAAGVAILPSLPAALKANPNRLEYTVSGGERSFAEIYLFEAAAGGNLGFPLADPNATALVIGGRYDTDAEATYYRIDFRDPDNSDEAMPVLRNHHYQITISDAHGRGRETVEEAFEMSLDPDFFAGFIGVRSPKSGRPLNRRPSMRHTEILPKGGGGISYTVTAIDENQ